MANDDDIDYYDSDSDVDQDYTDDDDSDSDVDQDYTDDDDNVEEYNDPEAEVVEADNASDLEFSVLSSDDIQNRVKEAVSEISSQLSVPTFAAVALLYKYKWINSKIYDEWFSDEAKTRKNCGLVELNDDEKNKKKSTKVKFFCGICLENYEGYVKDPLGVVSSCGHVFCETCWRTYVSTAIKDGPKCLTLRCPQPSCGALIGDMIKMLSTAEDMERYHNHVLRSYVESMKSIKWCTYPGCGFVVELLARGTISNFDVICKCENGFCWNCSEENHAPASCDLVAEWALKNNSESENNNWIICNTKRCPKCERSIEKNDGCMHMTCAEPCGFEFCWLCLGPWSEHGDHTGGFGSCNAYEVARKAGELSEEQQIREKAENELKKYTHFFERWMENHKSRMKAKESLNNLSSDKLIFKKLTDSDTMNVTELELPFITDAWVQIVECRRVLKWSYAYGYYIPDEEAAKRRLFEFAQGDAERNLEMLHDLAENELKKLADGKDVPRAEFESFRNDVKCKTEATRNFFDKLVKALANDLSNITT